MVLAYDLRSLLVYTFQALQFVKMCVSPLDTFGPQVSQKLGAAGLAVGYGTTCLLIYGWFGQFTPTGALVVLCVATICQNLGSCLVGIGGVASTIKSFPVSQRGVVTGLVKTGNGIASGIYTQLYLGFIAPNVLGFLWLAFGMSSMTVFICSHFLGVDVSPLHPTESAQRRLNFATSVIVTMLGIILTTAFIDRTAAPRSGIVQAGSYSLIVVFASLLLVPLRAPAPGVAATAPNTSELQPSDPQPASSVMSDYRKAMQQSQEAGESILRAEIRRARMMGQDFNTFRAALRPVGADDSLRRLWHETTSPEAIMQRKRQAIADATRQDWVEGGADQKEWWRALLTFDSFLLWLTNVCVMGAGQVVPTNLGQIAGSYGVPQDRTFYVSLFSFTNAASRPLFGVLSDFFLLRYNFPRTGWLVVVACSFVAAFGGAIVAISSGVHPSIVLPPLILISGLMNGAVAFLEPATISDLYDNRHYGKSFVALDTAGVIGAVTIAQYVPAALYDAHVRKKGGTECYGNDCWEGAFLFVVACCTFAALSGVVLSCRTAERYKSLADGGRAKGNTVVESSVDVTNPIADAQVSFEEYRKSRRASTPHDDYRRER